MKNSQENTHKAIYLKNYKPPVFYIPKIELSFDIDAEDTLVYAKLECVRNEDAEREDKLILNGENIELKKLIIDGIECIKENYSLDDESLTLSLTGDKHIVEIETLIHPASNKSLEGVYQSDDIICTQMEPQGFRKVTYTLDRPDVLSCFTTKIIADKEKYPTLLSNGNLIKSGDLGNGKHFTEWVDPFPKPCYLFALVAADLGMIEDKFITRSNRTIALKIFVDRGNENKAEHAMNSLKKSMKWDEDTFGLEYDLDLYMIVAVAAFNFGAMENKGLNIFNASAVLADETTSTDTDFNRIEGIVAHEYFHNWTGNRVTLRDWFQLTLKEGLTVFRDQEFSSDMGSRAVFRISEVTSLKNRQFAEDNGPTAHPIQPDSYLEINNFYTATVYDKGAEVIRMMHSMIGAEKFRQAMDLYIKDNDGKAATTKDFIKAVSSASKKDLTQFESEWYHRAGTPEVAARWEQNLSTRTLTLNLKQSLLGKPSKYHIPVRIGFIAEDGSELEFEKDGQSETILDFLETEQEFKFNKIGKKCTPSLFRDFSAPIKLKADYTNDDHLLLLNNDTDHFNRFGAMQELLLKEILKISDSIKNHSDLAVDPKIIQAFSNIIEDSEIEYAFKAQLMSAPSLSFILENSNDYDPELYNDAREFLLQQIANENKDALLRLYDDLYDSGQFNKESIGLRALKNCSLTILSELSSDEIINAVKKQYFESDNMTLRLHALDILCNGESGVKDEALEHFEQTYAKDTLVMNKWFSVQSGSKRFETLDRIKELATHKAFDSKNPNKLRSLYGVFAGNLINFHRADGSGYELIAEQIVNIDSFNPFMASSLSMAFSKYERLDEKRKNLMSKILSPILDSNSISKDTFEILSKITGQH